MFTKLRQLCNPKKQVPRFQGSSFAVPRNGFGELQESNSQTQSVKPSSHCCWEQITLWCILIKKSCLKQQNREEQQNWKENNENGENARSSQNQDRINKFKASDATSKQTGLLAPEPKIPSNVLYELKTWFKGHVKHVTLFLNMAFI